MAACLHRPFVKKVQLPINATGHAGALQPMVTTTAMPVFSFDFPKDELDCLRKGLESDRMLSAVFKALREGSHTPPECERF